MTAIREACGPPTVRGAPQAPEVDDPLAWLWRRLYAPDGHTTSCPACGDVRRFHRVRRRRAYACDHCGRQIYPTAATPFRGSSIDLEHWFAAVAALAVDPSLSPSRLAASIGTSPRTASRLRRKIVTLTRAGGDEATLLAEIALRQLHGEAAVEREEDAGVAVDADRDARADAAERISAAACRVVARRGMRDTRMVDIAAEAGVSPAIIHYYFKTKDAVLLAALRYAARRWQRRFADLAERDMHPLDKLRALIDSCIPSDPILRDEYQVWLEAWAGARTHPRFLETCTEISGSWSDIISSVLNEGVGAGVFRLVAPVDDVRARFAGVANDLGFRCVLGYPDTEPEMARELLTRFIAEQVGVPVAQITGAGSPAAAE